MNIVISQPMFFPWIGMFEQIKLADIFVHYDDVQFSKGSFSNRVQIKSPGGLCWLTVPLRKFKLGTPINEILINDDKNWREKHIATLTRCYKNSVFVEDMLDIVTDVYSQPYEHLKDLCLLSTAKVCQYLNLNPDLLQMNSSDMGIGGTSSKRVLNTVKKLKGQQYITGLGAKNYLAHQDFEASGIDVMYMNYKKNEYSQLHGAFTPYVSILDAIANVGPQSQQLINSNTIFWKEFIDG
ncbi:WbqC family protein [uncultured Paraglaciecola sp.]|uniref:WbqC family protein n=1 Tax=uncultured Paraglaciecola sp. TaxID=1765024 RepID=UPI00260E6860|nr:WbqC family protein [uncultured Paraglaciecola sp.]